jgi:glycosyltransferase involved in cell wall biosynthesis
MDLTAVLKLRSLMRQEMPDVVHLHTSRAHVLGAAAARLAGVKLVIATRRMQHPIKMLWPNTSAYGSWTHALVAISETVREEMVRSGVDPAKIRLIESGADVERFASASPKPGLRAELGVGEDACLLYTAAKLDVGKGVEYLIEATGMMAARGLPVHLVIAGDGQLRPEMEKLAQEHKAPVSFLGFRPDTSPLLAAIDIFVMPSLSEGLGIAAIEAMAAGKPVVATKVGGLRETVLDGVTGYHVPPMDPEAICEAVGKLIANSESAAQFGSAGQARAREKYSLYNMAAKNEMLYRELLGTK